MDRETKRYMIFVDDAMIWFGYATDRKDALERMARDAGEDDYDAYLSYCAETFGRCRDDIEDEVRVYEEGGAEFDEMWAGALTTYDAPERPTNTTEEGGQPMQYIVKEFESWEYAEEDATRAQAFASENEARAYVADCLGGTARAAALECGQYDADRGELGAWNTADDAPCGGIVLARIRA